MQVVIRQPGAVEGRTLAVGEDGRWREPTGEASDLLGVGWWALPGLVDAHAHLAADELDLVPGVPDQIRKRAYACLEGGVFLVIDKGWCDGTVVATLTDAPPSESPDFEAAGRIVAVEGGYYPGFAIETDAEDLVEVIRRAVDEGKGWVKLVGDWPRKGRGALPNFDPDQLKTAVDVAHAAGARVAIHSMAPDVASWAVAAGVDSIEHGLFLTVDDLEAMAAREAGWVPTILRCEALIEALGRESSGGRLLAAGLDNVRNLLAEVPDGVSVLAGTDLVAPSAAVGREVTALIRHGLDPKRAVDAASATALAFCEREAAFAVGAPADAVFFDRDPYEDPSVMERPIAVLRHGVRLR
jgi:imidazolonepropionase-like amidohydrolase